MFFMKAKRFFTILPIALSEIKSVNNSVTQHKLSHIKNNILVGNLKSNSNIFLKDKIKYIKKRKPRKIERGRQKFQRNQIKESAVAGSYILRPIQENRLIRYFKTKSKIISVLNTLRRTRYNLIVESTNIFCLTFRYE